MVTPRRPVKLYHSDSTSSSSSGRRKRSGSGKKSRRTPSSSSREIPGSVTRNRKSYTVSYSEKSLKKNIFKQFRTPTDVDSIPSPMTNGEGIELQNCDELLAQLGLSPMPKGIFSQPVKASPSLRRSPRLKQQKSHGSIKPSPLRNQVQSSGSAGLVPVTREKRNSLYRKLFEMKPKTKVPIKLPAKLKVGADMLPSKSVKPLTVPREFNFATNNRLVSRPPKPPVKASIPKPIPRKPATKPASPKFTQRIRKEPAVTTDNFKVTKPQSKLVAKVPLVRLPPAKVTIPKSPKFCSGKATDMKPSSVPKFAKVFQPIRPHKHTIPRNFMLPGDAISEAKRRRLEEQRKQKCDLQCRLPSPFRARPVPPSSARASIRETPRPSVAHDPAENKENVSSRLSALPKKPLTHPKSPKLSTSLRSQLRTAKQTSNNINT